MSALWAPGPDQAEEADASTQAKTRGSNPLRAVGAPAPRLARFPFMVVLIAVFGIGMVGLLMLNTTLQNQAFQSRALDRQATELAYSQADLENQLAAVSAPQELARRASAIGMRPNPYPAFLKLKDGKAAGAKVIGKAVPVSGNEAEVLIVKTPAEIAADRAAHKAAVAAKAKAAAEKAKAKAAAEKAKAKAAAAKAKAKAKAKAAAEKKKGNR
jgi:hypothetical protein